jgi:protein transport protein DSL1/ZW10
MSAAVQIASAIQEGTFIEDGDLVSSDLTQETIAETISIVNQAKSKLQNDIRGLSKESSGIDQWIAQAKRVQQDIQECKLEAQRIVQEHSRIKSIQSDADEAASNAVKLEDEITFKQSLQASLVDITSANERLLAIERLIFQDSAVKAAEELADCEASLASIKGSQVRAILYDFHNDLKKRVQDRLEVSLKAIATIKNNGSEDQLEITPNGRDAASDGIAGLTKLDILEDTAQPLQHVFSSFVVTALQKSSPSQISHHRTENDRFTILYVDQNKEINVTEAIRLTTDYVTFLHDHLPQELYEPVAAPVTLKIVTILIERWLNPAVPTDLSRLGDLDHMREATTLLAQTIESYGWKGAVKLGQWLEQSPRMWVTMRKAETLNAVRRIFVLAKGTTHQVERVERQKSSKLNEGPKKGGSKASTKEKSDDWDASWDDGDDKNDAKEEEDTSGWGFDDDEDEKKATPSAITSKDETADAWGWDDDEAEPTPAKPSKATANGDQREDEEVVLTEYYTITDIPDHLIEVIGRDVSDAANLEQTSHPALNDVNPSKALMALPTLAIAMFRATASTHYTNSPQLGNMHLYNDASYIAEKLESTSASDSASMHKFARAAYAREMDVQRTVLNDLLDGAQGFANCTQSPYSQACDDAVSSTIDHIRRLHTAWEPILSTSALLQSIGALLNASITKFINDIEDLEDISEAQSHRLAAFITDFTALQDIFTQPAPEGEESIPMTAVYTPLWLKLQYLSQILESSLVDIEYLWTEGELSLEFEAVEVVDLVLALFADSARRRAVVSKIKAGR